MPVAALTKSESRERWSQLRAQICAWDPIGVVDQPDSPRDEYDCLVGPLLTMLQSGATDDSIGAHLRKEIVEHLGLSPDPHELSTLARRLRSWFDLAWRDLAEPVTIFVALPDEGVAVWRPVQARPLGGGLFRIVGVEADIRGERWQFAAGAIVRCEERRFGDGTTGVTAVERVDRAG